MATDDDADDDDDGDDDGDHDDDDEDADVDVDVDVDGDELAALFSHYCSSNKIKPPGRRLEQFRSSRHATPSPAGKCGAHEAAAHDSPMQQLIAQAS